MAEADPQISEDDKVEVVPRRSRLKTIAMIAIPVLIIAGALWWWFGNQDTVSTDNAYVKEDIVGISSEVAGPVASVAVKENQVVKAGDLLFTVDPRPYQVAISQADAQIAGAQAAVVQKEADVSLQSVDVGRAQADLRLARQTYAREKALMDRGFNTRARMDEAAHAVQVAEEEVRSAQADVQKSRAALATGAQVPGAQPQIAAARATRSKAELDLSHTVVRAPNGGRISQSSRLQVGQVVVPGVPLLSIVNEGSAYIEANFKETDLNRIRVGQPVTIKLDAYPDLKLQGKVASIGAGTGSEFSVLPAQNATGNWIKVTQRVPVRIAVTSKADRPLVAGLSANVEIDVSGD